MRKIIVSGLLLGIGVLGAQEAATTESDLIKVDVNVVNVPVSVTDKDGRFLVDLSKDDFKVWENGKRVEIRYLTTGEDEENTPPLRAGILLDLSNAARLYYKTYKESIGDLAYQLVPEDGRDQGFLMGYHSEVDLLVPMTNDPYLIDVRLGAVKHGGGSAMLDAIHLACTNQLAVQDYQGLGEPRKVIVIIGDGHDTASKHSLDEVLYEAQRSQVTIHALSTVAWGFHEPGEENLVKLTEETGGRIVQPLENPHKDVSGYLSKPQDAGNFVYTVGTGEYNAAQLQALFDAIKDIVGGIRKQYVLGYAPPTPFSDGQFRSIRVEMGLTKYVDLKIRHRAGYYPPRVTTP
ncbi:MAG: VWA domain-containing protein [Acidobacteria bacterium]|nr:VWA domain-containing protein [Acidobacteriota bacterium]